MSKIIRFIQILRCYPNTEQVITYFINCQGRKQTPLSCFSFGYLTQGEITMKHYENKDSTLSTAIFSDDKDALIKLQSKLNCLIQTHERMVKINKLYRKEGHACLEKLNDAEKETVLDNLNMIESFYSDTKQKVPFPSYMLSNSNQRIRATRIRIDLLKNELKLQEHAPIQGNGFVLKEDKQDNRILFIFDDKPTTEVRALLKRYGFKWSPSRHAWIRKLNQNGRDAAHYVMSHLNDN